jgi:hypothetical protein
MFGLFKKQESSARKGLRLEFERVTAMLRKADETPQMAVGHVINMMNTAFTQQFHTVEEFQLLPKSIRMDYIRNLTSMEERMTNEDPFSALGVGLFKMWIGAVVANDEALMSQFFNELSYFSRKGNLAPLMG